MSTKITVAYGDDWHLYEEAFEEGQGMYLELDFTDESQHLDGRVTCHFYRAELASMVRDAFLASLRDLSWAESI